VGEDEEVELGSDDEENPNKKTKTTLRTASIQSACIQSSAL
jgi:hypothetical protein